MQIGDYKYAYDAAGNRTSANVNGAITTFSYNAANELTSSLLGSTTTNYTYDGNGNLTSGGGLSFTYNAQNQTTAINTDTYNYTGADQTDRVSVNSTNYTYGSLGLGSASNGGANTYYTRDNNGTLVSERTPTGTYYYSLNSLGSVSVITDSTGAVKNTYAYDPWGNSLGKTEAVSNPWQFASGYYDATTGLYKFGTRYYLPTLGRWTQQDPVGGSVGQVNSGNAYVYADDAPVMMTDPSGKFSAYCLGSISWNGILAGLGTFTLIKWAIPTLINVVSAAFTVDAATATIGEAILAAVGTAFGPWLWVGLAATLVFAAIYLVTTIQRDCSG